MKKKIIVFFLLFFILIFSFLFKKTEVNTIIDENYFQDEVIDDEEKTVNIIIDNEKKSLNLEDYVVGVVACEMPASFDYEALKAMSVAARTFALYKLETNNNYVFSTTTKDQCYITNDKMKNNWKDSYENNFNKIKRAVNETKNEHMTYNDKTIISFYFSISNGYTENCENVFSQKLDYLVSVDSSWDKEYSYKEKTVKFDEKEFLNKLNINSDKINNIKINRSSTGRAESITINNITFKGTKFRNLLGLRSTDVNIEKKDSTVYVSTKGYGHGVGMSQYGANVMAKKGYKYDEILKYYYKGIKIDV